MEAFEASVEFALLARETMPLIGSSVPQIYAAFEMNKTTEDYISKSRLTRHKVPNGTFSPQVDHNSHKLHKHTQPHLHCKATRGKSLSLLSRIRILLTALLEEVAERLKRSRHVAEKSMRHRRLRRHATSRGVNQHLLKGQEAFRE